MTIFDAITEVTLLFVFFFVSVVVVLSCVRTKEDEVKAVFEKLEEDTKDRTPKVDFYYKWY